MVGKGKGREKKEGGVSRVDTTRRPRRKWCIKRGREEEGRTRRRRRRCGKRGKRRRGTRAWKRDAIHTRQWRSTLHSGENRRKGDEGGREREGEYGERSLGVEMMARARKGEHREWDRGGVGCMRVYGSKIFPFLCFLLPLGFLFRDFLSSRPVTRVDENYSRNVDDLWTLYTPMLKDYMCICINISHCKFKKTISLIDD